MEFTSKTIALKNGSAALLRSPGPEDAAEMLALMRDVASETEFLYMSPEDGFLTMEQETEKLRHALSDPMGMSIVCEMDSRIAGNCQITFNRRAKTCHRATVAIALRKRYWGMGIGTVLMTELIAAARERGIHQIELDYIEGNGRGKALYEKLGFVSYGEHPDAIRRKDGSLCSMTLMRLVL